MHAASSEYCRGQILYSTRNRPDGIRDTGRSLNLEATSIGDRRNYIDMGVVMCIMHVQYLLPE
jgi:hypothetical protein